MMRHGLMRAHQERVKNQGRIIASLPRPATPAPSGLLAGRQLEELVSASLTEDLAGLKKLASLEARAACKRETLIPKYADYATRLMAAGSRHELLGYWLVWQFDAGNIPAALDHAAWCMAHGRGLPECFRSDLRFFVATQFLTWAEAEHAAGRAVDPYFSDLFQQVLEEQDVWNLPDVELARFYRLQGLRAERSGDLDLAESSLSRAFALGAKVKTALQRVQKIRATNQGAQAPGDGEPIEAASPDGAAEMTSPAAPED